MHYQALLFKTESQLIMLTFFVATMWDAQRGWVSSQTAKPAWRT